MPVTFAISEAVIGPSLSASSTLALFWPRGARAGALAGFAARVRVVLPRGFAAGLRLRRPPLTRDRASPSRRVNAPRRRSSSSATLWCRLSWSSICLIRALTCLAIALTSGISGISLLRVGFAPHRNHRAAPTRPPQTPATNYRSPERSQTATPRGYQTSPVGPARSAQDNRLGLADDVLTRVPLQKSASLAPSEAVRAASELGTYRTPAFQPRRSMCAPAHCPCRADRRGELVAVVSVVRGYVFTQPLTALLGSRAD